MPPAVVEALRRDPEARVLTVVQEFVNQSVALGFDNPNGYAVSPPADFARCAAWLTGQIPADTHRTFLNRPTPALCDQFAINYLLTYAADPGTPPGWTRLWSDSRFALWQSDRRRPRAEIFYDARPTTHEEAARAMRSGALRPTRDLFVEGPASGEESSGSHSGATRATGEASSVEFVGASGNRRTYRVAMARPGWLLLRETWQPGWRVRVDGREASVRRAQMCLMAAPVPAGAHRVEFFYRPRSVVVGLAVTLATLTALAIAALRRTPLTPAAPGARSLRVEGSRNSAVCP